MKYFTIPELTASVKAQALGIDNTPPPGVKIKLSNLINNLLDPIRDKWGGPISVNSGYRCPVLNQRVGGVPTSQHVRGEAADITVGSQAGNRRLFDLIVTGGFDFDQLIDESGYSWIHVSYSAGKNRRQILHL
nr:MAG TPA: peptidase [Caudoviricetes sp.]